ncbi:MAG TPA: YggT family protein [Anaerolineales bacterium]|nr:YggT family protein [Anaerolineales bacterium]
MSNTLDYKPVEHRERAGVERRARVAARPAQGLYKVVQLTWLLTGALEVLIGLRVLLKLIAANPANPFARFVYQITALFLKPFVGLTANPASDGMVLEFHALIAMLVYALLAWGIIQLLGLIFDQA